MLYVHYRQCGSTDEHGMHWLVLGSAYVDNGHDLTHTPYLLLLLVIYRYIPDWQVVHYCADPLPVQLTHELAHITHVDTVCT